MKTAPVASQRWRRKEWTHYGHEYPPDDEGRPHNAFLAVPFNPKSHHSCPPWAGGDQRTRRDRVSTGLFACTLHVTPPSPERLVVGV